MLVEGLLYQILRLETGQIGHLKGRFFFIFTRLRTELNHCMGMRHRLIVQSKQKVTDRFVLVVANQIAYVRTRVVSSVSKQQESDPIS